MSEPLADRRITRYECPECGHSEQLFYGAVKFHRAGCSKPDYERIEYVRAAALEAAEAKYHEFIDGLTKALNDAGVPAMPSWQDAIDYLVEKR